MRDGLIDGIRLRCSLVSSSDLARSSLNSSLMKLVSDSAIDSSCNRPPLVSAYTDFRGPYLESLSQVDFLGQVEVVLQLGMEELQRVEDTLLTYLCQKKTHWRWEE